MTMLLSEARDNSNFGTGKASDIARQLALTGIVVIWIFKTTIPVIPHPVTVIPHALLVSLWFFLMALMFDLLQYLAMGIVWAIFTRRREVEADSSASDTVIRKSPPLINLGSWCLFGLKIITLLVGYGLLLHGLWSLLRLQE